MIPNTEKHHLGYRVPELRSYLGRSDAQHLVLSGQLACRRLWLPGSTEFRKSERQPVAVRTILHPSRQLDQCTGHPFEPQFEEGAVVKFEQPQTWMGKSGKQPNRRLLEPLVPDLLERKNPQVRGGNTTNGAIATGRIIS